MGRNATPKSAAMVGENRDADRRDSNAIRVALSSVPDEPVVLMSKRILISLILVLSAGTAAGESGEPGTTNSHPTLRLGDSDWLLYRPQPRVVKIHDFDYMMSHLRTNQVGLGLRFSASGEFRFDLTLAPIVDRADYVGPVYDMDIGATRVSLSWRF